MAPNSEFDAQPPNAAPSTTIPRMRFLLIPDQRPSKRKPSVDRNGERGESRRQDLAITGANPTAVIALACAS
jgi:hypothetical protein